MYKNYIALLSAFVACTSIGMQQNDSAERVNMYVQQLQNTGNELLNRHRLNYPNIKSELQNAIARIDKPYRAEACEKFFALYEPRTRVKTLQDTGSVYSIWYDRYYDVPRTLYVAGGEDAKISVWQHNNAGEWEVTTSLSFTPNTCITHVRPIVTQRCGSRYLSVGGHIKQKQDPKHSFLLLLQQSGGAKYKEDKKISVLGTIVASAFSEKLGTCVIGTHWHENSHQIQVFEKDKNNDYQFALRKVFSTQQAIKQLEWHNHACLIADEEKEYQLKRTDDGNFEKQDITDAASHTIIKDHVDPQWIVTHTADSITVGYKKQTISAVANCLYRDWCMMHDGKNDKPRMLRENN